MPRRVVPIEEVIRFITAIMIKLGTPEESAIQFAEVLVTADYSGMSNEGLRHLEYYIDEIKNNKVNVKSLPSVIKEGPASAWVNGSQCLAPVVGHFCVKLASQKALESGVGIVVAKGVQCESNPWYTGIALRCGMIGMMFSNTMPTLVPCRATQVGIGHNSFSMAIPTTNEHFAFNLNFGATTRNKLEALIRANQPIPEGWVRNPEKKDNIENMHILPLGGSEETCGHKGYGLSLLAEILCGVLGGASYESVASDTECSSTNRDLGMCFIVINPECFEQDYAARTDNLLHYIRKMTPMSLDKPVMVPGDSERLHMMLVDRHGGITYPTALMMSMTMLAKSMDVEPMQCTQQ